MACFCEYGNEPSCSIRGDEFVDEMGDYPFLKKNSALWS
jgi:hypothetical protein